MLKKKYTSALAVTVCAVAIAAPSATAAPIPPTQGDAIYTGSGLCTLGFNDHETGVSYTAAHCGGDGARVALYDRETDRPITGNIGTLHLSPGYDQQYSNDFAWIEWDPGVTMGENIYSGDIKADITSIKRGVKTCFHGETSHTGTNDVTCGKFHRAARGGGGFSATVRSPRSGDSGGPIWVEEQDGTKKFAGVLSAGPAFGNAGAASINGIEIKGKEWLWAAPIAEGKKVSQSEASDLIFGAAGINEAGLYDRLLSSDKSSERDSSSKTEGSSDMSPGEIAAIVVPIVLALLSLASSIRF